MHKIKTSPRRKDKQFNNSRKAYLKFSQKARNQRLKIAAKNLKKENLRIFKRLEKIDLIKPKPKLFIKKASTSNSPSHQFSLDRISSMNSTICGGNTSRIFSTPKAREIFTPESWSRQNLNDWVSIQEQIGLFQQKWDGSPQPATLSSYPARRNLGPKRAVSDTPNPFMKTYLNNLRLHSKKDPGLQNLVTNLASNLNGNNQKFLRSPKKKILTPVQKFHKANGATKRKIFSDSIKASSGMTTMYTLNNLTRQGTKETWEEDLEMSARREKRHLSPISGYVPVLSSSEHKKMENMTKKPTRTVMSRWF